MEQSKQSCVTWCVTFIDEKIGQFWLFVFATIIKFSNILVVRFSTFLQSNNTHRNTQCSGQSMEWVLASFHSFFSFSGKEGFVWRLLDKVVSHYGQIDTDWGFIIVQYLGHLKFYWRTFPPSLISQVCSHLNFWDLNKKRLKLKMSRLKLQPSGLLVRA